MVCRQAAFVVAWVLALCSCCLEFSLAKLHSSEERFAAASPETRAVATSAKATASKPRTSPTAMTATTEVATVAAEAARTHFSGNGPWLASPTVTARTFPSERCAAREEWQSPCSWWTGEPHNRHLKFDRLPPKEGIGANLLRVAWALNRAMLFDLEPEFVGPFLAGHGTGDFGQWFGLTENPLLAVRDPEEYKRAQNQEVPFPEGNEFEWFDSERNRTSVVYTFAITKVEKIKDWGWPISPPPANPGVCRYVRQSLRDIFWSKPGGRDQCRSFFAKSPELLEFVSARTGKAAAMGHVNGRGAHEGRDIDIGAPKSTAKLRRPWVVAVHVRRGDMIKFKGGKRVIPHSYFVATVASALQAIAGIYQHGNNGLNTAGTPRVAILVFSEGPQGMGEFQLMDEHGEAMEWNVPRDTCQDMGLECYQEIFLHESAMDTFDCLAAADIVIGSESSFSEAAAAVSTNVKVMLWDDEVEQDRVTLDAKKVASLGRLDVKEQAEMDRTVADWWHCSREAWASRNHRDGSGGDHGRRRGSVGAGGDFYQTFTMNIPGPFEST